MNLLFYRLFIITFCLAFTMNATDMGTPGFGAGGRGKADTRDETDDIDPTSLKEERAAIEKIKERIRELETQKITVLASHNSKAGLLVQRINTELQPVFELLTQLNRDFADDKKVIRNSTAKKYTHESMVNATRLAATVVAANVPAAQESCKVQLPDFTMISCIT